MASSSALSTHAATAQSLGPHCRLPALRSNFVHPRGCGRLLRRNFSLHGIAAAGVSIVGSLLQADSARGIERLPYKPEGYNFWTWRGHRIHYVEEGKGIPIVLIHGFGASAFHWRYNIPELAKKYKVYAIDLLGFGWSDKAVIDYDAVIWRDQLVDFLKEIVKEPAVLVGNSLGGFTSLVAAAEMPEKVVGVALLNSAGQFGNPNSTTDNDGKDTSLQKFLLKPLKDLFQRIVLGFLFWQAKQPARIESVLKSVYINTSNVDDYLIQSIMRPAEDPNAGEVYYRYFSSQGTCLMMGSMLRTVDFDDFDPLSSSPDRIIHIVHYVILCKPLFYADGNYSESYYD